MYRRELTCSVSICSPPTKESVAAESIQSSSEGKALAEPRRESRERRPNTRMARLTMGLWHV